MLKRLLQFPRLSFLRSHTGFTLTDVVIGIAILTLILATVTPVLVALTNYRFQWNEQRVAENLARNHMEYVKVRPYIEATEDNPSPVYVLGNETVLVKPNPSWEVNVEAYPVRFTTIGGETDYDLITEDELAAGETDQGIQEIYVAVYHVDKRILETTDYKVDRLEIWRGL